MSLIVSFIIGVFLGHFLYVGNFELFFLVFALGCGAFLKISRRGMLICFLGVIFGIWRFYFSYDYFGDDFRELVGDVVIEGCVLDEVDVRSDKVKYVLSRQGRVMVNAERWPVHKYGDCLRVSGEIARPEEFEGFAYDQYLARYEIYSVMNRPRVEKVGETFGFWRWIFDLKGVFETRLNEIFGEPHGSFMAGLILGSRRGIPEALMADFQATGLTHIIAISGYNITLLIVIIGSVFGFLGRRAKVLVSSVVIVMFVVLVGASSAVVRAAIMGVLSLFALYFGRQSDVIRGLMLAAFFMGLWNPKILVFDTGFQLSFLATLGLIVFGEKLMKWCRFLPEFFAIRESIAMTLSAQIFALPVIIYSFGSLSLISPIANVLVLPFIPVAMIFGFLAVAGSFVWSGFGLFFGFLGYFVLEIVVFFVEILAQIS